MDSQHTDRPSIYVSMIIIHDSVERKIRTRAGGGCTGDEVREAFVRASRDLHWEDHPEYGLRIVGIGWTAAGRELFAVLLPNDPLDGTWILKTARPL